jgi:hypothetical protein
MVAAAFPLEVAAAAVELISVSNSPMIDYVKLIKLYRGLYGFLRWQKRKERD